MSISIINTIKEKEMTQKPSLYDLKHHIPIVCYNNYTKVIQSTYI